MAQEDEIYLAELRRHAVETMHSEPWPLSILSETVSRFFVACAQHATASNGIADNRTSLARQQCTEVPEVQRTS